MPFGTLTIQTFHTLKFSSLSLKTFSGASLTDSSAVAEFPLAKLWVAPGALLTNPLLTAKLFDRLYEGL